MEGVSTQRIAMLNLYFRSTLFTVFAVLFSLHPVEAAPRKPSVIVKVNDVSHVDRLTKKFDWSATNLVPANEPQDIYQEVADHVSRRVGRDAANSGGNDQDSARQLRGKIQRSVVKHATMTTPYGVTRGTICKQLIEAELAKSCKDPKKCARYLAKVLEECIPHGGR